jgi:thiosulfate/3-mercaptopyruvate sulfurtransferase
MGFGPLVDTDWLAAHLPDPALRLFDVRWYLDPSKRGADAFRAGHIPGARFMDADTELAVPGGRPGGALGRHPWPPVEQVEAVMSAAGVGPETTVVGYDDAGGAIAARLWYVLRAHGHDRVAVLDGGIPRWLAEGRPTEPGEVAPFPAARFSAKAPEGWVVSKADVRAAGDEMLLLDARAPERYRGEVEPIDPRGGHLPGARSAPVAGNLTSGPTPVLKSPEELRELYVALGADRLAPVAYCGSGITACHILLALEVAGLPGRLYAGSYSEWSSDPDCPVTVGPEP